MKRDQNIFWKLKGIAAKNMHWLFTKYGDPEELVDLDGRILRFADGFRENE